MMLRSDISTSTSTEFRREVVMSMSDGVYELFPIRDVESVAEEAKMAVLFRAIPV